MNREVEMVIHKVILTFTLNIILIIRTRKQKYTNNNFKLPIRIQEILFRDQQQSILINLAKELGIQLIYSGNKELIKVILLSIMPILTVECKKLVECMWSLLELKIIITIFLKSLATLIEISTGIWLTKMILP